MRDRTAARLKFTFLIGWMSAIAWLLAVVAPAAPAAPGATTRPLGVWYQSIDSFPTWKARGVTLLIGWENEGGAVGVDKWCAAAKAAGLHYILQSVNPNGTDAGTAGHWNDPECDAVQVSIDEPNQLNANKRPPATVFAAAIAVRAKTAKPIFINLDGGQVGQQSDAEAWGYCQCADWIGFDLYSLNNGHGWQAWVSENGTAYAKLRKAAGPGKTIFVAVESSDQDLRKQAWVQDYPATRDAMRGPTPEETTQEILLTRQWGGIPFIFPDGIGAGFETRDATNAAVDGALRAIATNP